MGKASQIPIKNLYVIEIRDHVFDSVVGKIPTKKKFSTDLCTAASSV